MSGEYYSLGDVLPDLDPNKLEYEDSRRLLAACFRHPAFEVVELRRIERQSAVGDTTNVIDGIVVECCDGTVPSRNAVGIKNREPLLLLHGSDLLTHHEVLALRAQFPITPHQNSVPYGAPSSLCLYFEPWSAVARTWTPATHLQRILWWLRETALGTLHRSDQPLERLHFVSPFQIVLPADFATRAEMHSEILQLAVARSRSNGTILRGEFESKEDVTVQGDSTGLDTLLVTLPAIVSVQIERYPVTLGALHDQLIRYGSELFSPLVEAAKKVLPTSGLPSQSAHAKNTLLLLRVPMARSANTEPERIDVSGFIVRDADLAQLGIACGAYFDGRDGRVYLNNEAQIAAIAALAGISTESIDAWRGLAIEPVDVRCTFSATDARHASGIGNQGTDFKGVLAGLGALGSTMAELWHREGWGNWSYIDDDILHAHNIVRHIGKDLHIGWAKVDVAVNMAELSWPTGTKPKAISAKVTDFENIEVCNALSSASLLVDATTTLEAPRDLSEQIDRPRAVSVFLTPSGRDSVLLLENSDKSICLSSLEAQYYRAILQRDWGPSHLDGHQGSYWVGAGCRDLSAVLSLEVIQLHGAMLARQVRFLTALPEAQIRVWSMDDATGALAVDNVLVEKSREDVFGKWRVIWDDGLLKKLREFREISLPNETGGVVLGYFDQKRKAIHVVDVLPAPTDSEENGTTFVRGAHGLKDALERSALLTANIVGYLGEWHSHPKFASARPSSEDVKLLTYLANTMAMDDVPVLMIIVGENDVTISFGEGAA
ncbi:Mov34/MPN/PAD-1 family protein [Iodobacter fluviatilis]|uniref:Integrative and conjugative element protein (TIGR02256 family) n=1 Tax=Iodobacter fluviatilis TaxID=537 RepID=A0A377SW10_9NEIS|nr:Mov34/MPN/PAD-1 family protein [Iodobacter fluviatilis]TCU81311.1 integrative and conjugative element protein (TIGR02256 family) [Iodobacter fluviatilis]STR45167.1 ThiF family [Iodobacter fluviatilis]